MSTTDPEDNNTLRETLLAHIPCFAAFTPKHRQALADLLTPITFHPGDNIVTQDDWIDNIYILQSGEAEVVLETRKKQLLHKKKIKKTPLAIVTTGDSIGLSATGFYSATGKRSATVTAVTTVTAFSLSVHDLHQFLEYYPELHSTLKAAAHQMLKIRLIKQSLPFVHLADDRILWLAQQVQTEKLAANTLIFKQGDPGDRCYLIQKGQVEIVDVDTEGHERHLATLKPPTLFGEATLITRTERNATARALTDCELLVLEYQHLSELIETEDNVAQMFMTLMVDRSKPQRHTAVTEHHRTTADGQAIVILKNPNNHSYFKLSEQGWFIWQQLNGQQTLQAITLALSEKHHVFVPDVVAGLISKLAKGGFVTDVSVWHENGKSHSFLHRLSNHIKRLLEIRVTFPDADTWITRLYNKGIYLLFTRLGKLLLALLALSGFSVFLYSTHNTLTTFQWMPDTWILLIFLVPATLLTVALHELGHAFATKSFGHEVHYMGVGWFWLGPVAFTDTSDMWLSSRGPRTVVNLAGIYTDILVAGFASLWMLVFSNPYIQGFLWLFALFTYINSFRMLSPLQELDGYYVLMDWVDKPHLRQAAIVWLVKDFPKALKHPSLFRKHTAEVIYWLACILFLIFVSLLTLLVQLFIFKIFGIHANPYLSLSLPLLMAVISSLGIVGDIRERKDQK